MCLTLNWACSLLKRMGYVKRKASINVNSKLPLDKFLQIKASFLQKIVGLVKAHAIPPELIINLDETSVPVEDWTMALEGSRRVEVAGLGDKRQLELDLLTPLVDHFFPCSCFIRVKHTFPDGFHVHHTPNYWANEETVKLF